MGSKRFEYLALTTEEKIEFLKLVREKYKYWYAYYISRPRGYPNGLCSAIQHAAEDDTEYYWWYDQISEIEDIYCFKPKEEHPSGYWFATIENKPRLSILRRGIARLKKQLEKQK